MLSVAVVGCGKAGENHVRELSHMPAVQVLAVCDTERLMAEQLAARYGIARHYADLSEMLARERPLVVHIATPPQSHLPIAVSALDAGCHVLVEKPLAVTHLDAERLVHHAMSRQRQLTVGYGFLFEPICDSMRALVAEGVLGEPVHVESYMGYAMDGQFGAPVFSDEGHWVHDLPGKLVHNVLDHLLNKVTEFIPDEHPVISTQALHRARRGNPVFSFPDELRLMVSGAEVTGYATFSAHARPLAHTLTVFGTRNTLDLNFIAGTLTLRSASRLPGPLGRLAGAVDQSWQHLRAAGENVGRMLRSDFQSMTGLRRLITRFHDSVRTDGPPPIPYHEILRVSALMDRVIAQLQQSYRPGT